ncbi:Ktr system potassium transporter B [Paenalkalicoccus suaedae]|uniref:Ktr system potassium transporter B n=1 Tax=Paenalkalicoccus suaedae TaxID=2592382 RepID=A0A859FKK7_9BACI|nr:Ktr system potassium transporter B [Paenalkalicoccus suaedae]
MFARFDKLNPPQFLAVVFGLAILVGSVLLWLPIASTEPVRYIDALFTATSATTVTGLVVVDTGTVFTRFGQVVIMALIKLGGLGLMSFAVLIVLALGKRLGLRERLLIQQSFNQPSLGGIIRLVKVLLIFSFSMELFATFILALRWVPEYGLAEGLFQSLFHAISAFNNAGFSLWSDSLTRYIGDPVVNLIITILFITGGLGFTVVYDLVKTKHMKRLALHSKIMLVGTLAINVVAMLMFFLLERGNPATLGALTWGEQFWATYFQAVTPRTAGFNTLDFGAMEPATITFMLLLMFIGAGSASTGGGIKVTTFVVIVLAVVTYLRGARESVAFSRAIKADIVIRALAIVVISLSVVFVSIFVLSMVETAPYLTIVFEAFSAFGTVGLSMGITDSLTDTGKMVLMWLMFLGRLGPVSIAFALAKASHKNVRYPKEDVFTG